MKRCILTLLVTAVVAVPLLGQAGKPAKPARSTTQAATQPKKDYWVANMKKVHAKFKGETGTFAHFGDSITISMAFWSGMKYSQKGMDPKTQAAFDRVKGYMKADCWDKWKGSRFGNTGRMTIRWAHKNVDTWLKTLKPEAALIMFGTNDLGALKVDEYETKTREVVKKCLANGTIVILQTIPPRHARSQDKVKRFVKAQRKVAHELKVPLSDYYQAIIDRRPADWSGRHPKFKDVPGGTYDVPTLISRDGVHPSNPKKHRDYSAESLKNNGFLLRNWVTLMSYDEVIRKVLKPEPATKPEK